MTNRNSPAIYRVWACSNCKTLNRREAMYCQGCAKPQLNGAWPKDTWFQDRLRTVRLREAKEQD